MLGGLHFLKQQEDEVMLALEILLIMYYGTSRRRTMIL
jgi:hypothetical protein